MQMLCTVKLILKDDLRLAVVKINTIVYLIDCYLYILQVIKILVAVVVVFLIAWGPRLIIQVMQHMKLEMIYTKSAFWTEVNDNNCLLSVVNDNNCLLSVVNDNTCLLLVVNDNTCLLSVVITWKTVNITLSEQFQSSIATSYREVKCDNTSIHNYSYYSYDT